MDSVSVGVDVFDHVTGTMLELYSVLDINCLWKPQLHPDCNFTRSLMNYMNPNGLCTPTCITSDFSHFTEGPKGSNNDWTLQITHSAPDSTSKYHGRVLYGSVPNTERFCLVTSDVFMLSPGPKRDSPAKSLDMTRCDVTLVKFKIWVDNIPERSTGDQYVSIPVRELSQVSGTRFIHIPTAAENTLNTITVQAWGTKIGVKIHFVHPNRSNPRQEELAAALDWILGLPGHRDLRVSVVVLDINLRTIRTLQFSGMSKVYGSRIQLLPGVSGLTKTMAYSTCTQFSTCLLLTRLLILALPVPGQKPPSPTPSPAPREYHGNENEPFSTLSPDGIMSPTALSPGYRPSKADRECYTYPGKVMILVCPSDNPERFLSTTWYKVTNNKKHGLYRINHQTGVISIKGTHRVSCTMSTELTCVSIIQLATTRGSIGVQDQQTLGMQTKTTHSTLAAVPCIYRLLVTQRRILRIP